MKRLLSFVLAFVLICLSSGAIIRADTVDTSAQAFALYCPDNGEFIISGSAEERLPMASTTKIMTALITLEHAADDNMTVEFTEDMTAEGSSMYLKPGEKVTLDDLAVGMMMQSGNDAANAAAIAISGSIEAFSELMNAKAEEIGMTDTHFVTPSGLDDDDHYSTARDMALLMEYAMKNERFREITSHTSMTVDFIEPPDKSVTYPNHNKLLRMYEGCIGGKTGYTDKSGRCLVTAAERGGMTLIAVTLNDRDDWNDHIRLYDFGFGSFNAVIPDDHSYTVDVVGGVSDSVTVRTGTPDKMIALRNAEISETVILPPFVYAPASKGEIAGKIIYESDGEAIGEVPLLFDEDVEYNDRKRSIIEYIKDILNWH